MLRTSAGDQADELCLSHRGLGLHQVIRLRRAEDPGVDEVHRDLDVVAHLEAEGADLR